MVTGAQDAVQGTCPVAVAVDEAAGALLEVALLRQCAGEVQAGYVHRLVGGTLLREPVVDDEGGAAGVVEEVRVEAESGAQDDAVVEQFAEAFRGPCVAEGDTEPAVGGLLDVLHGAVQDGILRFELIAVQEVVVHRAQMSHEVGLPRHFEGVRAGDVDHRGLRHEGLRRFEGGVALADDQHALIDEGLRVGVEGVVPFGESDPGDVRLVEPGDTGRDDEAPRLPRPSGGVADREEAVGAGDADDLRPVLHTHTGAVREVAQVAHEVVGPGEVLLAVPAEQQVRIVAQQRVPVHPQVEFRVAVPGVHLVDRDQLSMSGVPGEERAGPVPALQDGVVPSVAFHEGGELESGRACPDDQVVAHHGRNATAATSEGSEIGRLRRARRPPCPRRNRRRPAAAGPCRVRCARAGPDGTAARRPPW